jgi:succinate dehydrogenase / fumarate reductase iron-sulfur subunit
VRDLVVDRSRAGELLRQLGTWIELEPRAPDAELPVDPELEQRRVELGRCSSCGACLEACPQYGPHTDYVGAAAVARVAFLAGHPVGALTRRRRITALMTPGGIADCGKAEACVEVCPQQIPLVDALQTVGREASRELLLGWLLG